MKTYILAFLFIFTMLSISAQDSYGAEKISFASIDEEDEHFARYSHYQTGKMIGGFARFFPYFNTLPGDNFKYRPTQQLMESAPSISSWVKDKRVIVIGHYYIGKNSEENYFNSINLAKKTVEFLVHASGLHREQFYFFGAGQCEPMYNQLGETYDDSRVELWIYDPTKDPYSYLNQLTQKFVGKSCFKDELVSAEVISPLLAEEYEVEPVNLDADLIQKFEEIRTQVKDQAEVTRQMKESSQFATKIESIDYQTGVTMAAITLTGDGLLSGVKLEKIEDRKRIEIRFPFPVTQDIPLKGEITESGIIQKIENDLDALDRIVIIDLANFKYKFGGTPSKNQLFIIIKKVE